MPSIRKRTNKDGSLSYRVDVRLKGFPPQRATFTRLTDAKKWGQQTEVAIRENRYFKTAESRKHTLTDLIDRYITDVIPTKPGWAKVQKSQLIWWKEKLGDYVLGDITQARIIECRDNLLNEKTKHEKQRTPATVVRYLSALSHAFTIAINEWNWLDDNPMRKVKKPKESRGRVRFLSEDEKNAGKLIEGERSRLLKACQASSNKYLYPVVVLALSTGMRRGEIMNLKWIDVGLKTGAIILHETKNGERRRVPLAGKALQLLTDLSKARDIKTKLLFPSNTNKEKPIDLRKPWLKALQDADIENFRFHDLRHSAASYLAMNGASLAEIAEVLGHKTLQMVKRYAHLSEAHTESVVASMNKKIFG